MIARDYERKAASVWRTPVLTWIALMALLAINAALAFLPLGRAKLGVNLGVAVVQVALLGFFFMRLDKASWLVRLTALAGLFWLVFLFALAGSDYLSR